MHVNRGCPMCVVGPAVAYMWYYVPKFVNSKYVNKSSAGVMCVMTRT